MNIKITLLIKSFKMVEALDPREILKDTIKLLNYEPLNLTISVLVYDFSIDDSHYYHITKQDGRLNFVIENSFFIHWLFAAVQKSFLISKI